jgi:hypothetical protein
MGTQQSIKEQDMHRRFKRSILLTMPLVFVGVLGLGTLMFFLTESDLEGLDFSIGNLWQKKTNATETVLDEAGYLPDFDLFEVAVPKTNFQKHKEQIIASNRAIKDQVQTKVADVADSWKERGVEEQMEIEGFNIQSIYQDFEKSKPAMNALEQTTLIKKVEVKKGTKWAIGLKFAPGVSYRMFRHKRDASVTRKEGNVHYIMGESQSFRNNNDRMGSCLTAGLDLRRKFNEKWSLETGLYMASFSDVVYVEEYPNSNGDQSTAEFTSSPESETAAYLITTEEAIEEGKATPFSNSWTFVEIPLKVVRSFELSKNRSIEPSLGASFAYLVRADALMFQYDDFHYEWVNNANHPGFNRNHIFVSGGTYFSQFISPNTQLYVHPEFKMDLSSIYSGEYHVDQRNYQFNVGLGCKVHF